MDTDTTPGHPGYRALTVRQPWAWALLHGGKGIENRSQVWSYRGLLLIHAAAALSATGMADPVCTAAREHWETAHGHPPDLVRGALIGAVTVVDTHRDTGCCRPWGFPGAVHMVVVDPITFVDPVPVRGSLSLWRVPDSLSARATALLAA